jgi:hypothetical protein
MRLPEPYLKYRTEARRRFSFCSPFRLGIAVGEAGVELPTPYSPGSKAADNYDAGVQVGRDRTRTGRRCEHCDLAYGWHHPSCASAPGIAAAQGVASAPEASDEKR